MTALFNGRSERGAWISSRGLHYGDGVFRTVLVVDGKVVDLDRQMAKLATDAERLNLKTSSVRACRGELQALAVGQRRGVAKILLWRKAEGRGYRPTTIDAERLVMIDDLPPMPESAWTRGVSAQRSSVVLSEQPLLAGIKHLGRMEQVLAARELPRTTTEAIQCDANGRPISGSRTNLFWVRGGRLYTPDLSACGVAGVMRQKVLEVAEAQGLRWQIAALPWDAFAKSDEAFVTNSLIGICPLRSCDGKRWQAPGAVTRALMTALDHPLARAP